MDIVCDVCGTNQLVVREFQPLRRSKVFKVHCECIFGHIFARLTILEPDSGS